MLSTFPKFNVVNVLPCTFVSRLYPWFSNADEPIILTLFGNVKLLKEQYAKAFLLIIFNESGNVILCNELSL